MNSQSEIRSGASILWRRVLTFPLVRIIVAILFIAIPFAIISTPFNLFVTDKPLRRVGAALLTAVVLGAYWFYVRVVEKRDVAELSGRHAGSTWRISFGFF